LTNDDFVRNIKELQKEAWNKPIELNIGEAKALALSWEMQVLHLCIHMAVHITYGGLGLRQLSDLFVVLETKRELIDWNNVVYMSIKYDIEHFTNGIFLVCSKLFQMDLPYAIASKNEIDNEKIEKLIDDILSGGNFGKKNIQRTSANVLINNSYNTEDLKKMEFQK